MTITLNKNIKIVMVHIITFSTTPIIQVYFFYQAQIMLLLIDKVASKVLWRYFDYADIYFYNFTLELLENISMNEYFIKLVKSK